MQERGPRSSRRRTSQAPEELAAVLIAPPRRRATRRIPHGVLAALTGTIEGLAATAGPVVEATADAVRGDDPARQHERLVVALRNFETAMSEAAVAVRAALETIEGAPRRAQRHK